MDFFFFPPLSLYLCYIGLLRNRCLGLGLLILVTPRVPVVRPGAVQPLSGVPRGKKNDAADGDRLDEPVVEAKQEALEETVAPAEQ